MRKLSIKILICWQIKLHLFAYLFIFLGPHLGHMEIPRLEVKSRAAAACLRHSHSNSNPGSESCLACDLHHSSQQCRILNPLSEARDQIHILMDTSWFPNPPSHSRHSSFSFLSIK